MKLFVDMQGAQTPGSRDRGIGHYSRELFKALAQHPDVNELNLGWNHGLGAPFSDLSFQRPELELFSSPYGGVRRKNQRNNIHDAAQAVNDLILRRVVRLSGSGHVLFTSLMETDTLDFVLPTHLNYGPEAVSYAIVYDIIPHLFPERYLDNDAEIYKYQSHLRVLLSADYLLTISETTRRDLIEHMGIEPDKIVTIGAGVNYDALKASPTPAEDFQAKYGLTRPFLFFLGGDEFRKNLAGLVAALPYLKATPDLQILVAGKVRDDTREMMNGALEAAGWAADTLIYGGFLSHADIVRAYHSCAVTVIPSLYEGFGLPVLEAMFCGAPLVASGNSSMAEIVTDSRFLFDPYCPEDIADKITFALTDKLAVATFRRAYANIMARHDWKLVAQRVAAHMSRVERPAYLTMKQIPHLKYLISGDVSEATLKLIETLSARYGGTVFCETRHLQRHRLLPFPVDSAVNLFRYENTLSPILAFADTTEDIRRFQRYTGVADTLLIGGPATFNDFTEGNVLFTGTASMGCIHQNGCFSAVYGIESNSGDTVTFMECILDRYFATNPYRFAQQVRDVLKTFDGGHRLYKEAAAAAAVSVLEREKLTR